MSLTKLKTKFANGAWLNNVKEYFTKINEIIDYLNRYLTPEDQYQTTIVNISSSQILNMGTTPIELLPAPGVNKYYDIEQITFEYTYGTTSYNVPDSDFIRISDYSTINFAITERVIAEGENTITIIKDFYSVQDGIDEVTFFGVTNVVLNKGLYLEPISGNPTNGDGTLRAIIKYKVKTFGE